VPIIEVVDLYKKAQEDTKFNADKGWETVKFSATLSSTLITVTLGLLGVINYLAISPFVKAFLTGTLVIFPIMMGKIIGVAQKNFERECERMYEAIATLMKIEEELPQRVNLNKAIHFREEPTYINPRWNENKYSKTDAYIKDMMLKSDKFHSSIKPIFSIFRIISNVLLGIVSFIFVMTIVQSLFPVVI